MTTSPPVYVALDTIDVAQAAALATAVKGLVAGVKLGLEFFSYCGPRGFEAVADLGMPLFLDLKLHDIPNTVAGAMRGIAKLAPRLTTIHASGGFAMMQAAAEAAREGAAIANRPATKVLAVTVLTSLDQQGMTDVGFGGTVLDQVKRLAEMAQKAGVDGLVCSPHEVSHVRDLVGPDMILVVPGIRPAWAEVGDQKRFMTPKEAMRAGADLLVIGRPINSAASPADAARRVAEELR